MKIKLSYQVANIQKMKEVTNMTNTNKTTAPMSLTELKAWAEETCELSELLQTKDYKSYLPEEKQEEFEAIAFSVFNCLESFSMMLEDDELHYQPKPIEEESDLDNQVDEMAQYNELMKEVEDSDKEAREIAYDDTIHGYIDKRTEQLKEQATFEELINKVALYESELLDYAERLLSDEPLNADSETAIRTLDMLDDEAIDLFKSVDIDNEYQGLEYYNTNLNKED
ncbi:hypothetical protein VYH59_08670 [Streptococcus anginosus]|nr:hypothetical protein [Streptococcus anginosus]MED5868634.1 hypothetical protein [Streptococcus anginosus]